MFRKGAPGEPQISWEGGEEVGKGAVRGRVWGVTKLSEPPAVPLGMPGDPLGMPAVWGGDMEPLGAVSVTSRHRTRAKEEEGNML